jgi:hypothetical protein
MAKKKKPKSKFYKFGYGALALYAVGIISVGAGAYGFTLTNLLMKLNESARIREQVRTGRVTVTTDHVECRTYRFDNVTSQVGAETVEECDQQPRAAETRPSTNSSFDVIRDGFNKR